MGRMAVKLRRNKTQRTRGPEKNGENILFLSSGSLALRVLSGCSWLKFTGITPWVAPQVNKFTQPFPRSSELGDH
jgi:hypothetical protein